MKTKKLILIVDDELSILHLLKESLEDEAYFVETLNDGKKVVDVIGKLVPDVVLLDIFMPGCNGIELLTSIKNEYPHQKIIVISGFGTISIATEALKKGASDFIEKPFNLDDVLVKIAGLVSDDIDLVSVDQSNCNFEAIGIVGASTLFSELMHHAKMISQMETPVLIYGPEGSGKKLFAHYIHAHSFRSSEKIIEFNCAAGSLLSNDLFNNNGSLVLNNIEYLTIDDQQKLLHFLEKNTGPRVMALSKPSLFSMVQKSLFNISLFCKLNATPCEIPSINKRRYDIPFLVSYFLKQANITYKKSIKLTSSAIRFLRNYQWIGDVAEIKKIIYMMVMDSSVDVLDTYTAQKYFSEKQGVFLEEQLYTRFNSLDQATTVFQRQYLQHLLRANKYDTSQLANFLQIPLAQLKTTMIKLKIDVGLINL